MSSETALSRRIRQAPLDLVALDIAHRYPCSYGHVKYIADRLKELGCADIKRATEACLDFELSTNVSMSDWLDEQILKAQVGLPTLLTVKL